MYILSFYTSSHDAICQQTHMVFSFSFDENLEFPNSEPRVQFASRQTAKNQSSVWQDKYLSSITYSMRMKVAAALSAGADTAAAAAAAEEVQAEAEAEEAATAKETKKKRFPADFEMVSRFHFVIGTIWHNYYSDKSRSFFFPPIVVSCSIYVWVSTQK